MPRPVDAAMAAAIAIQVLIGGTGAAQASEAREGYDLARQWCTSCHIIAPGQAGSDAAPPFSSIANRAAFSEDGLRAWLADPHPPMPNLNLSRHEIDRVIAYLRSLRRD